MIKNPREVGREVKIKGLLSIVAYRILGKE